MSEPRSYEEAREELADVVRRLEAGGVSLEESLSLWERGEALAEICERWLDGARARLIAAEAPPADPPPAETATWRSPPNAADADGPRGAG